MYDAHNKGEQREVKFEYYVMDSDRLKSEIKTVTTVLLTKFLPLPKMAFLKKQ